VLQWHQKLSEAAAVNIEVWRHLKKSGTGPLAGYSHRHTVAPYILGPLLEGNALKLESETKSPFNTKIEVCSTRCHVKTRHATFYVIVLHD
jgi:hypothetical protein